jgi:outer membrane protein OmpA-like peptidoglycan-associated protein
MNSVFLIKPVKIFTCAMLAVLAGAFSVFAQVDAPRQATAITFPLDETVIVQFRGTTRFPRMKGEASIRRTAKSGTRVELTVERMPRPFDLGGGYATYVLWAVSPEGAVDNLGEIKRRGTFEFNSKFEGTTNLQTFALIITAEPHFLVKRPSRTVMLENLSGITDMGKPVTSTRAVSYLGNSSDYYRSSFVPEIAEVDYSKTPPTILQARQAVALAKFAGAQRDAATELTEAEGYLSEAENSWRADRPEETIDIKARQAVSSAVKAEETALVRKDAREKRNETLRRDAETRKMEDQLDSKDSEIKELRDELARETRNRELGERDVSNLGQQIKDLRDENARLRNDLNKSRTEVEDYKIRFARIEGEKNVLDSQRRQAEREERIRTSNAQLLIALKPFGVIRENTNGGVSLVLPETYFTGLRASTMSAANAARLDKIGEILARYKDYKIVIESNTDDKGLAADLERLTTERAQLIANRFVGQSIEDDRIEIKGQGGNIPLVPNTSLANRAKNRRVEIILTPINVDFSTASN